MKSYELVRMFRCSHYLLRRLSTLIILVLVISSIFWSNVPDSELDNKIRENVGNDDLISKTNNSLILEQQTVDFRIIVITFNRPISLQKLLATVDDIELDGDRGCLEIWIDRNKQNEVHNETLVVANAFTWKQGPTKVYIQREHVGIYGQWIGTWKPAQGDDDTEIALILEDDLSVSKFVYRWLKAVHTFYDPLKDFGGATVQGDEVVSHDGSRKHLKAQKHETVFMYKCIGTWGFSPKASVWKSFQEWYSIHIKKPDFHPYVPGIVPTQWYQEFEKTGRADTMWAMWFIYFAYKEKLYTLYSNLNEYNSDGKSCLSINRREVGLHYEAKGREDLCKLLDIWKPEFKLFSRNVTRLDWNGKEIHEY